MSTENFNLDDRFEISVVDNKIYWVEAEEWENYLFEYEDENEPVKVFTDYLHGECEIVDSGTLLLHPAKEITEDEHDASDFYEELETLPKWHETECFVTDLDDRIPEIRNSKSGNHVPLDYALYVMERQLGYFWNPDAERFEKPGTEVELTYRKITIMAQLGYIWNSKIKKFENATKQPETIN